jgi:acyl carrier protein
MGASDTKGEIKKIIVEALNLEGMAADAIGDNDPLFGEGLGLDSVDALELVVSLEKAYGVKIDSDDATRESFKSVESLAALVDHLRADSQS